MTFRWGVDKLREVIGGKSDEPYRSSQRRILRHIRAQIKLPANTLFVKREQGFSAPEQRQVVGAGLL